MLKVKFAKDKKIGLAVSGGLDSMVLLDLAIKSSANIIVVNIDHGIRGEVSKQDSLFVKKVCQEKGVQCLHFPINVPAQQAQDGESIELVARKMRYQIFNSLLTQRTVDIIALAHHQNDQTETLLMRIFRGTGIRGLKGITDSDRFVHPFIKYSKAQLLEYAKANNIEYREDATNKEIDYTRNFIRNKIIPLICERYPALDKSLERLAENCNEADAYLESKAVSFKEKDGAYILPAMINSLHPLIIKYSIARTLRAMGIYRDIESRHYDDLLELLCKQNNKRINLPFEIDVYIEGGSLTFIKTQPQTKYSQQFVLSKSYEFAGQKFVFCKADNRSEHLAFDADKLPSELIVRTRQNGDIFKACNGRTKLLGDYLQQKKVPARKRDNLLVVAKGQTIYAVLGIEISDLIKIDKKTKNIYEIKKA